MFIANPEGRRKNLVQLPALILFVMFAMWICLPLLLFSSRLIAIFFFTVVPQYAFRQRRCCFIPEKMYFCLLFGGSFVPFLGETGGYVPNV